MRRSALAFVCVILGIACGSSSSDAPSDPAPGTPGGVMTVPVGTKCAADGECGGGRCVQSACVPGARCTDDSTCAGSRCVNGGCVPLSATDGIKNGDETDVDCGGTVAPRCADGKACKVGTDCVDQVCGADGTCAAASATDGVKNGTETDVDCGGGAAPPCDQGKACAGDTDCFWGHCTNSVCEGHRAGTQDGDESDVDCGGTKSPGCDWWKKCKVDADCASGACGLDNTCQPGPSCKTQYGGMTCGIGEDNDGFKNHESCCKSLPVPGYTDPNQPGKTVYVDKYEITAGRMRKFLETLGGGTDAAGNAKDPDVKGWIAAHVPSRWNAGWSNVLPSANFGSAASYTVANPTVDRNYPGNDVYAAGAQSGAPVINGWSVVSGNYNVDVGVFYGLGAIPFFPEFVSSSMPYDYPETHDLNCSNKSGSYGLGTYWFDSTTINQYSGDGSVGKFFSKDQLDEKALNCTTFATLAAFCAWDGGQLMTAEAFDYIAGGPWPANAPSGTVPPRLAGGNQQCGGNNSLNTFADGTQGCYSVYFYPDPGNQTYDASSKVAAPGRVPADTVTINAGDEPWMDMKGNLEEAVMRSDNTRFDYRGYGVSYSSIQFHKVQASTARMKGSAFGARCMRFK